MGVLNDTDMSDKQEQALPSVGRLPDYTRPIERIDETSPIRMTGIALL